MNRRNFLKSNSTLGAGALSALILDRLDLPKGSNLVEEGMTIVFQGDSITDAGRDKAHYYANQGRGMGGGYVHLTAAELLGAHPEQSLKIYNRGISGHKVHQLDARWDIDCLSLKPDVLSILIGVNDFWHTLSGKYDGTAQIYNDNLRRLLDRTLKALPEVKLMLGMPFAVSGGSAINDRWGDFTAYQQACKEISADYNTKMVPYQVVFDEALKEAPASYWCPDGVHPSMAGAYLMKEAWMRVFSTL